MTGLKSTQNAAIALAGIEMAHRIRKRQFAFVAAIIGAEVIAAAMGPKIELK
jgi:hypothetical protein